MRQKFVTTDVFVVREHAIMLGSHTFTATTWCARGKRTRRHRQRVKGRRTACSNKILRGDIRCAGGGNGARSGGEGRAASAAPQQATPQSIHQVCTRRSGFHREPSGRNCFAGGVSPDVMRNVG
ncbi:hypothetical protein AAVH_15332 [Aphelenchoides avenae]|nr:hypothetical protein AAVH_15332 [Aphelenchus avenae]